MKQRKISRQRQAGQTVLAQIPRSIYIETGKLKIKPLYAKIHLMQKIHAAAFLVIMVHFSGTAS